MNPQKIILAINSVLLLIILIAFMMVQSNRAQMLSFSFQFSFVLAIVLNVFVTLYTIFNEQDKQNIGSIIGLVLTNQFWLFVLLEVRKKSQYTSTIQNTPSYYRE